MGCMRIPNHLLQNGPRKEENSTKLYAYVHLDETAIHLLSHGSIEVGGDDPNVLQFRDDSDDSLLMFHSDKNRDENDIHLEILFSK